tara:strand:+ start:29 stop:295 length:267 start_codon:yes stop_codon:yes gene_type:complete
MPRPHLRSRSLRKVMKKLPGGRLKKAFLRRKPSKAVCAVKGTPLSGVPQGAPYQIKKLSKSKRRPQRPYGGVLGSKALRELIIKKARK